MQLSCLAQPCSQVTNPRVPKHLLHCCRHNTTLTTAVHGASTDYSSSKGTTEVPVSMPSCLLLLPGTLHQQELHPLLQEAHSRQCSRVYLYIEGPTAVAVTTSLLQWLAELYAAVGQINPRWDVIPCLPSAGWNQERLHTMPDVQLLLAPADLQQQALALQLLLITNRPEGSPPVQLGIIQQQQQQQSHGREQQQQGEAQEQAPVQQAQQQEQHDHQQPQQQHSEQPAERQQIAQEHTDQQQQQQLQFSNVAVGGTFDRLHAGHRLLLAATALVATGNVFVGITADNLLAKKSNKHLLQDYEARRAAAVDFMALVGPVGLSISAGALSDPQEPTQAELDASMEALVVSAETLSGGEAINQGREGRGFDKLELVVVGLVGGSDAHSKLSSTALRQAEAEPAGTGSTAPHDA